MLKRTHIMSLMGAAVLAMTSSAWAGNWWNNYGTIDSLNTVPGIGYRVYGSVSENPYNCPNTGHYDPLASAPAAERQLMDKTLLAAFLAGRKVKLNISTATCSADGYPVYAGVRLNKDE